MEAVAFTGGVLLVAVHCREHGHDVLSLLQRVTSAFQNPEDKGNQLLEEAVWEARIKQYHQAATGCVHLAALIILGMMVQMKWNPESHSLPSFFACMLAWGLHHVVGANLVECTRTNVRLFVFAIYALLAIFTVTFPNNSESAVMTSSIITAVRFAAAIFLVDFNVMIPAQTMLGMLETYRAWSRDSSTIGACFVFQLGVWATILIVSGLVESTSRSRIATVLNAEAMVHSFRRVLRGVCDGEILLDGNLRIKGKADCLKTLLMTSNCDFCETSFENFLVEDERKRFRCFIEGSVVATSSNISAPACLRVSLKRGRHRVGVDLFHVPHQLGEETLHLIALREDSDLQSQLEVQESELLPHAPTAPSMNGWSARPARSVPSDSSISQVSASSMLQICSELKEMTLLVDPTTPLLDVLQAHLSFAPDSDRDSSMPCLRKIVRPTDWGTIRKELKSFAVRAKNSTRETLKMKLRLQDESRRCVEARRVEVSAFQAPGDAGGTTKLCLQLEDLKLVKPLQKRRCELQGVHESDEGNEDEPSTGSQI